MANIIRTHVPATFMPKINGITFELFGPGSVSADIADQDLVEHFLAVPDYRLAVDEDEIPEHLVAVKKAEPKKEAAPKAETAKERKAREAAEKAAEEEAKRKAEEEAAAAAAAAKADADTDADSGTETKADTDADKDSGHDPLLEGEAF